MIQANKSSYYWTNENEKCSVYIHSRLDDPVTDTNVHVNKYWRMVFTPNIADALRGSQHNAIDHNNFSLLKIWQCEQYNKMVVIRLYNFFEDHHHYWDIF